MTAIRFHAVHFGYDGREPLLEQVVLHLSVGFTGIVGPNGAGKTTLLRLAVGELAAPEGAVVVEPRDASVQLCEQRVDVPSPGIVAFSLATDRSSMRWMRRFALDPYQVERWQTLSAGERKRWQLAAALALEPDVLALDEPTNHLDLTTRELVLDALRRFRGTASSRIKGPKDSDARSIGAKNLAAWAAAKAGNVVARRRQALHKAEAIRAELTMEKVRGRTIFLDWEPPPRRVLSSS